MNFGSFDKHLRNGLIVMLLKSTQTSYIQLPTIAENNKAQHERVRWERHYRQLIQNLEINGKTSSKNIQHIKSNIFWKM